MSRPRKILAKLARAGMNAKASIAGIAWVIRNEEMDNAEAIKRIENHIRVHRIGEYPHIKIAEALNMAISALANDNNVGHKLEIPCRIGDEVWVIRNYQGHKHPQKGFVSDMLFTRDMRLSIVVKHIARGEWGKDVFATYEEAAETIEERKGDG